MHDSNVRVMCTSWLCGLGLRSLSLRWSGFFGFEFQWPPARCYSAQYGSACSLCFAWMDMAIKKAATDFAFWGGFFVYGHILLGSAVTISGKNHKIASASTIKQK